MKNYFKNVLTAITSKQASQTFLIAGFLSCIRSIKYPGASVSNKNISLIKTCQIFYFSCKFYHNIMF